MNSAKKLPVPVEQKQKTDLHGNGISRRKFMQLTGGVLAGAVIAKTSGNLLAYAGKEGKGKETKEASPTPTPAPVTALSAQGRGRVVLNGFEVIVAPNPTDYVTNYEPTLGRAIKLQFKDLRGITSDINQNIFIKLPNDQLLSTAQPTPLKTGGVDKFDKETLITGVKMAGDSKTYFYLLIPGAKCLFYLSLSPDINKSEDAQNFLESIKTHDPVDLNPQTLVLPSGAFAALIGNTQILVFKGNKINFYSIQDILNDASTVENKPITTFNKIKISEDAGDVKIDIDTISKPYFIVTATGELIASGGP